MALTLVQNKVCPSCGADVRPNALFCYSCGGAVSAEEKKSELFADEKPIQIAAVENKETAVDEISRADSVEKPVAAAEEIKLKSAASLRRKSKSFQNKPVEVVWEEHENAPNVWFISIAVFLTIVAAAVLFLAMRLK